MKDQTTAESGPKFITNIKRQITCKTSTTSLKITAQGKILIRAKIHPADLQTFQDASILKTLKTKRTKRLIRPKQ